MSLEVLPRGAALALSVSCMVVPGPATAGEFRTVAQPIQGQYIVVFKEKEARLKGETGNAALVSSLGRQMAQVHRAKLVRSYDHVLRGFVVQADDAALAHLLADPRVAYVEEDGIARAHATQAGATWGIDRIDQRDAPVNGSYVYNSTASTVHAYVVDTGVLGSHAQFTGRMSTGYTAIADGRGTTDCHGHGTHVAGTLGGTTYGVAKAVKVHPVRVLGCDGTAPWSQIIAGIDWVKANHVKPAVANLSLGGFGNTSVDTAVANLTAAGVTVAVSAGNDNADACLASPARAPSVITVGSTRKEDQARSHFSNYGACLDLFAPGSAITSAWHTSTAATNVISGTSMASPHVAGAAALYLATNPTATPSQVNTALISSSSPGRVLAAGSGSPNRLLYTLGGTASAPPGDGTLPAITGFACPGPDSGGNVYVCVVQYTSTSPAAVLWPNATQGAEYSGTCVKGEMVPSVTVTVGNRYGSVSRSSGSFLCPSNQIE